MIVVRISGGLGNQMFQYAFARALQARGEKVILHWHSHHSKAAHNGFELDRIFKESISDKIPLVSNAILNSWHAWRLRKTARIREVNELQFQPNFLEAKSGYLDGYWQTEEYFKSIAETIRADFQFKALTGAKNLELLTQTKNEVCCSVHVRRGDYIGHPELGGICDESYYQTALAELDSRHPDCRLIVFSDDIDSCRTLFCDQKNIIFCDWNTDSSSWMDMVLMQACRHHIIANSSFSWWGSWLSDSNGLTISPRSWSSKHQEKTDICPENWLKL